MSDTIRILHLSDLHFASKKYDQKIVLRALADTLEEHAPQPFDLALFSGDLVNAGSDPKDFASAKLELFDKVIGKFCVAPDRFIVCPGNHDVDRDTVRKEENRFVEVGLLGTLIDRTSINAFVDSNLPIDSADKLPPQLARLTNFYRGSDWFVSSPTRVHTSPFAIAHRFKLQDIAVGVVSFNSAWRATGEPNDLDYGRLIVGERAVDVAATAVEDCTIKIAMYHHPPQWWTQTEQFHTDGRLQAQFDLLLSGHNHRASPEYRDTTLGEAIISQAGCLYQNREWFNGFSTITIRPADAEVDLMLFEYTDHRRRFVPATRLLERGTKTVPFPPRSGRDARSLSAILRRVKHQIKVRANAHISLVQSESSMSDIDIHFVPPPLSIELEEDFLPRSVGIDADETTIDAALSKKESLAIVGRPESGKTSVAHYIAVKTSLGNSDIARLPLIGRFQNLKAQRGEHLLWQLFRDYAHEISDDTLTRADVEKNPLLAIVDGVDLLDDERMKALTELIDSTPNARWVLMVDATTALPTEKRLSKRLPTFGSYSIKFLSRNSIRALSASWMDTNHDAEKTDEFYRSVMEHIRRMGLPRSGYIVSLVLWALKNKFKGELLNEAVLLENILDYLLGRMDYRGALRAEFDFNSKTAVLQELAVYMKEREEAPDKNEVVSFLIKLLKKKALRYDADLVVAEFLKCGVLHAVGEGIEFRYRRFQDFFVAGYLRDNQKKLKAIAKGDEWMNFTRELDLFSARFRHEGWLLEVINNKITKIEVPSPDLDEAEFTTYLATGPLPDNTMRQLRKMRAEPMSAEKIDKIMDRTEKRLAERRERAEEERFSDGDISGGLSVRRFMMALEMYSQLVRNLEFVDRDVKEQHFAACMKFWNLAFRGYLSAIHTVLTEFKHEASAIQSKEAESANAKDASGKGKKKGRYHTVEELIDFVEASLKTRIPTMMAELAYHSIGSEKLAEVILDFASKQPIESPIRLISVFVLIEIAPERAIGLLKEDRAIPQKARWVTGAIVQRLYAYYATRPIPEYLASQFESLLAELELEIAGKPSRGDAKGRLIEHIRKQAYKEKKPSPGDAV